MVDRAHQESVPQAGIGRPVNRRQGLSIAIAVALGALPCAALPKSAVAAKDRKNKDKDKDKNKKKGKNGRTKDAGAAGGNEIVQVAMKYKGSKYKWGGASPKGFDCSGFTWYVYQQATGMDITRGVDEQWRFGRSVGHGDWQPGDIVFFENTFERGLSHCGIFIGGNEFIHAENEQTGVIISTLDSDYYSDHYAGARRLL